MSLKETALSCSFASRMWRGQRNDKSLANEIAVQHNTSAGVAKVGRNLFPGCDGPLKAVLSDIERAREVHEFYSVPWPPSRAVKITAYPIHRDKTTEAIGKFDISLQQLYEQYPSMVEQGLRNSNGLSSEDEYLKRDELFERFAVTVTYGQLDDASDWLKSTLLSPEEAQELIKQSQQAEARRLSGVSESIKDQLAKVFINARDNLAKRCDPDRTNTNLKERFNTAWLDNLNQLVELLPAFNLMDDPTIPKLVTALQPILKHSPETMKTSEVAQIEAWNTLRSVIDTYSDWLNG